MAPAPPPPARAGSGRRHARGGSSDLRAARTADVVRRAHPCGHAWRAWSRMPCSGLSGTTAAWSRPGPCGGPSTCSGGRLSALGDRPEHVPALPQAGLVSCLRPHPRGSRRAGGCRGRRPRRPHVDQGGAGLRGLRGDRFGRARREARPELGRSAQAGFVSRQALLRTEPWPEGPLHPTRPVVGTWVIVIVDVVTGRARWGHAGDRPPLPGRPHARTSPAGEGLPPLPPGS